MNLSVVVVLVGVLAGVLAGSEHRHRGHDHAHGSHHNKGPAPSIPSNESDPVTLAAGGVFRGSWMETRRGRRFQSYRGIRYAEPPVGELRFQPPRQIHQYSGEVDATKDGPACPLPVENYYLDEDCLTINVYTPENKPKKLRPVIMFIHAGGFYSMTGRSDVAGPHYLLDKEVVLVTINYRLGSLGFLSTGDALAPGNNGMKDQVAAMRWVRDNIRAFGGDPDRVTLTGCSAGSISVMLHMMSPMSKGLFHAAISMSVLPTGKAPSLRHMHRLAVKQAELVNCPTDSNQAIFDCLKKTPWKQLGDSLLGFYEFGFDPVGIWFPVVELDFGQERFLDIEPMDAIRLGKMHHVPYIISQTTAEFFWMAYTVLRNDTLLNTMNDEWDRIAPISFQLPTTSSAASHKLRHAYIHDQPLRNDSATADSLGKLYSDATIAFNVHRGANLMCRHSPKPVWRYEWAYVGEHSHYEDPVTNKSVAAAHHDDLIYLFSLSYRFPTIPLDSPDNAIVEKMTTMWENFATYGDPNPRDNQPQLEGLSWPTMKPEDRKYLRIGDKFSVHERLIEDRMKVWEELYPIPPVQKY